MEKFVKAASVTNQHNESYVEGEIIPKGASVTASKNVVTMDESVASNFIPDKHNE